MLFINLYPFRQVLLVQAKNGLKWTERVEQNNEEKSIDIFKILCGHEIHKKRSYTLVQNNSRWPFYKAKWLQNNCS